MPVDARPAVTGVVCGVGSFLPPTAVPNVEVSGRLGIDEDWISTRTGIEQRHCVAPGTATSDLAVAAGEAALKSAGTSTVDAVVLATSTPDQHCPATAPLVAHGLGLAGTAAFDVSAVCSGFVYALAVGTGLLAAGVAEQVLVIGADAFSTIVHPDDRDSAAVFGDGAGALVLRRGRGDEPGALLGFDLGSDGAGADLIGIPDGGSRRPLLPDDGRSRRLLSDDGRPGGLPRDDGGAPMAGAATGAGQGPPDGGHWFAMAGRAVYRQAVAHLAGSCRRVADVVGWGVGDVDRFVLHQANRRILQAVARELQVDPDRMPSNIARVANTAAASIPLLLDQARWDGQVRPGDRLVLAAFGGGLAWGGAALVWPQL